MQFSDYEGTGLSVWDNSPEKKSDVMQVCACMPSLPPHLLPPKSPRRKQKVLQACDTHTQKNSAAVSKQPSVWCRATGQAEITRAEDEARWSFTSLHTPRICWTFLILALCYVQGGKQKKTTTKTQCQFSRQPQKFANVGKMLIRCKAKGCMQDPPGSFWA